VFALFVDSSDFSRDKCEKHKFIHLLMATFKDLHIKNNIRQLETLNSKPYNFKTSQNNSHSTRSPSHRSQ